MAEIATEMEVPTENILQPDLMRRVAWEPEADIASQLSSLGARDWQVEAVAKRFTSALEQANQ
jgi:ribonuclease D